MDDKNTEKFGRRGTAGDAVDNEPDESAPAFENDDARGADDRDLGTTKVIEGNDDADEPMDWGERWKITRQFASMSRSSAMLLITFLLVLLLYMWVKEDPVVTFPTGNADETSETSEPAETTEPSGETSPTDTAGETPSGTESAAPTAENQDPAGSQVPTQSGDGSDTSQNGGTGGTSDTGGQTDAPSDDTQGTQDGAGTDQSAPDNGNGTALGTDTEQNSSGDDTGGAEPA